MPNARKRLSRAGQRASSRITAASSHSPARTSYANLARFDRAVRDFEAALALEPTHENALKYLHMTRTKALQRMPAGDKGATEGALGAGSSAAASMGLSARVIDKLKRALYR